MLPVRSRQSGGSLTRPLITAMFVAAGLAGLAVGGRAPSVTGTLLLTAAVARSAGGPGIGAGQVAIRMLVGAAPAVVLVAAIHDLAAVPMSGVTAGAALAGAWTTTARTLGAATARAIEPPEAFRDIAARLVAVTAVTAFVAGSMVRLLLPPATSVERLGWILAEEDNAHVVGVAREVIVNGPRGAELGDQFGTAFMNLPLLLGRVAGGLPSTELDPRLQAVSAFTLSTLVVILLAGLAMALLAALPHHVHRRPGTPAPTTSVTALASVGTAAASAIGMSTLVVLPMRTGFLTFVWGLTLVLLGAASAAVLPADARRRERAMLLAFLAALGVLLLSSWPFILPALAGLLLLPLTWVHWSQLRASLRKEPRRWVLAGLATAVLMGAFAVVFTRWGPAAEVLSYGRGILLVQASGIAADDVLRRSALVAAVVALVLVLRGRGRAASAGLAVSVAGPIVGAGVLYGALRLAAEVLTGGELNYSGVKLLYGIVVLAAIVGLLTVLSQSGRWGSLAVSGAAAGVTLLLLASPTASLITDWGARTAPQAPPHAVAAVAMIDQTTPNLPIRCLPAPGTVITGASQWAAYWCARWMEDAFNEGRFQGHRDELRSAEGETFGPLVEEIIATSPSEYLFSARMTLGPGWFGWDGRSRPARLGSTASCRNCPRS